MSRAILAVVAFAAALGAAPVVRVTPDYQASRCDGVLHIEVQGVDVGEFATSGRAWVSFEKEQGPAGVLPSSINVPVDYTLVGDMIRMDVPLAQRPSEPLEYQLTVRIPDETTSYKNFNSLPHQRIEASTCAVPLSPGNGGSPRHGQAPPLTLTVEPPTVRDLGRGLFSVRFHVRSNREAAARVLLFDIHRQPALFNASISVDPSNRLIQFTSEGSPDAILDIREPGSPTALYSQNLVMNPPAFSLGALAPYLLIAALAGAVCWLYYLCWQYFQRGFPTDRLEGGHHRVEVVKPMPSPAPLHPSVLDRGAPSATWQKDVMNRLEVLHWRLGTADVRLRILETAVGKFVALLFTWHPGGERKQSKSDLTIEEQKLLAALNFWWRSDAPKRDHLLTLLKEVSIAAAFYELADINHNIEVLTETKYTFRQLSKSGAWLLVNVPGSPQEYWAVPADPAGFQGNVMALVRRMYPTFDAVSEPTEFLVIYRGCRVRQVEPDKYEVVPKGHGALCVKGSPPPNAPAPPDYDFFRRGVFSPATFAEKLPQVVTQKLEDLGEILMALRRESARSALRSLGPSIDDLQREVHAEIERLGSTLKSHSEIGSALQGRLRLLEDRQKKLEGLSQPDLPKRMADLELKLTMAAAASVAAPAGGATRPTARPVAVFDPYSIWIAAMRRLPARLPSTGSPVGYLSQVVSMEGALNEALAVAGIGVTARLAHIVSLPSQNQNGIDAQTRERCLEIHSVRRSAQGGVWCPADDTQLEDREYYQLYALVDDPAGDAASVFVPAGRFSVDRHPFVLGLLVGEGSNSGARILQVLDPARIERVKGDVYRVVSSMKCIFETVEAGV